MKIFIFTTCFAPSIGGIERLTELLATQFAELGHEVTLATSTPGPDRGPWSFRLLRQPSPRRFWSLLRRCDVHLQANLSLKHLCGPLGHRRFFVTHQNDYSVSSGRYDLRGYLKLAGAKVMHGAACSRYIARRVGCAEVIGNPYDDSIFCRQASLEQRDKPSRL
jgi:glycogen(starch) synthase